MFGNLNYENRTDKLLQIFLILFAFTFPLTVFGGNLLLFFILILWLLRGNIKDQIQSLPKKKFLLYSILFFIAHVIGLLWTEDLSWGWKILKKMIDFSIVLPLLYMSMKRENSNYYISSFLLSLIFTVFLSYLLYFGFFPKILHGTIQNPTPTMSHISYNIYICFGIYILAHKLLFNREKINTFLYSSLLILFTVNMFITEGRAGHIMFFAALFLLFLQYFDHRKIRTYVLVFLFVPLFFFLAYNLSDVFKSRVTTTKNNVTKFFIENDQNTSIGLRFAYALNTTEVFLENPMFGVGTGDFPREYSEVHNKNTPDLPTTVNPHNMYLIVLSQLGIFGFSFFVMMFYYQFKSSLSTKENFYKNIGVGVVFFYLVIMFSDSYLLGHFTTILYVFLSSIIYRNFE